MSEKKGWFVENFCADVHEVRATCYCIKGHNQSMTEVRWSCDPKKHPELLEMLQRIGQYIESHLPELPDEFKQEFTT